MTAKILAWSTFGLLLAGSVPFVSDPTVSATVNAYGSIGPAPSPLPPCGQCNIQPAQEFQKPYAIDRNTLCDPSQPYRMTMRLATKVICQNGSYWICEDTSTSACSTYVERFSCPQDSCQR